MKLRKGRLAIFLYMGLVVTLGVCVIGVHADDGGADHRTRQARPIELGTSGGSIDDFDFPFCCGGTLGALVENASGQFILSNNHVLARSNRAISDEDVTQPGLIDVGCAQIANDVVADLSDFVPINFDDTNLVDAAIAAVRTDAVDTSGSILDIGPLSPNTVAASVGMEVKKSGRTTGLTTGQVAAVDVSVSVKYPNKCGGRGGPTATFLKQIRITDGDFSAGGDSGSVIVEDVENNPGAVGLLFAGSSSSTLANSIDNVLSALGVAMVGGAPPPPPPPPPAKGTIAGTVTSSTNLAISGATVSVDGTSHSDTTLTDGIYSIPDVGVSTYSVTASATGFESQSQNATVNENQTTIVDFALTPTPPPPGGSAIVDCITYTTFGGQNGDKHLTVAISVVDDTGSPISGATVAVTITGPKGLTDTGETDSQGNVSFTIKNAPNGMYTTDVTDVNGSGDLAEPSHSFTKGAGLSGASFGACNSSSSTITRIIPPTREDVQRAIVVKRLYEHALFAASKNVVGVGVGSANGKAVIEIYLANADPATASQIPDNLGAVPVRRIVTGEFLATGWGAADSAGAVKACRQ